MTIETAPVLIFGIWITPLEILQEIRWVICSQITEMSSTRSNNPSRGRFKAPNQGDSGDGRWRDSRRRKPLHTVAASLCTAAKARLRDFRLNRGNASVRICECCSGTAKVVTVG